MNKFSFWGWTLILLGVYLISVIATTVFQFSSYGYGMEIYQIVLYYVFPAFWSLFLIVLVAGFAALVGKGIFRTQAEGFFMTMNCLLVADILMRISWPVIMKMMQYLENFGGLFPGGF